jgi:hypothetical protein
MASETTNYKLHKIDRTDAPPDITVLNKNWDKLDAKLKEVNDLISEINDSLKDIGDIDLSNKADLVNGKIPESQLPDFSTVDGVTIVLTTTWAELTDGTHVQVIDVEGITDDSEIVVDCDLIGTDIDADIAVLEAWGCVNRADQVPGALNFYCYGDVPTVAIPLNLVVM